MQQYLFSLSIHKKVIQEICILKFGRLFLGENNQKG